MMQYSSGTAYRLTLLTVCLVLLAPLVTPAEVWLESPRRVARGDAFPATVYSDEPARSFEFFWQGKRHVVHALPDTEGRWRADILLPVPLAERADGLELSAGVVRSGQSGKRISHQIVFYDKNRPVQKLTVDRRYVNPPASQMERIRNDRKKVGAALAQNLPQRCWSLPLARPVAGGVSSLYGMKRIFNGQPRSVHRGLDLRGAAGTPVLACADGRVALTDDLYFSGNAVYINHGEGIFTSYLHLSKILVSAGQTVRKGQVIGLVGATGRVTGPHLHLSLIVQGQSVDPQPLLADEYVEYQEAADPLQDGGDRP